MGSLDAGPFDESGAPISLSESLKRYGKNPMFVGEAEDPGYFPNGTPIVRVRSGCLAAVERTPKWPSARAVAPWNWPCSTPRIGRAGRTGSARDNRFLRYEAGELAEDVLLAPSRCKMPGGLEVVVESSISLEKLIAGKLILPEMLARLYFKLKAASATLFATPVRAHYCLLLRHFLQLYPDLPRPYALLQGGSQGPVEAWQWWHLFKGSELAKISCFPEHGHWVGLNKLNEVPEGLPEWQRDIVGRMLGK